MDTSVSSGVTSMIATASPIVISTYVTILGAVLVLGLAIFGIKLGWGKIWRAIKGGH